MRWGMGITVLSGGWQTLPSGRKMHINNRSALPAHTPHWHPPVQERMVVWVCICHAIEMVRCIDLAERHGVAIIA